MPKTVSIGLLRGVLIACKICALSWSVCMQKHAC